MPDKKRGRPKVRVIPGEIRRVKTGPFAAKDGSSGSDRAHSSKAGTAGALIGDGRRYTSEVKTVLDQGAAALNKVGDQWKNCKPEILAGHAAEADHVGTFNADAVFQGKATRAHRLASNHEKSVDISVTAGRGGTVRGVSSKVYRTAEKTADAQRGYGEMDRLTPAEQVEGARTYAAKRAVSEALKDGPNRQRVSEEFTEVAARTTDRIKVDGVESQPRTRAQSQKIGDKAKQGSVSTADIAGGVGRRTMQGAAYGARTGAAVGAAVSGLTGSAKAIVSVSRGEKTVTAAAVEVLKTTATGTLTATVRGTASGAATAAARVAAERVGSQFAKRALGSSAPAAVAIFATDAAIGAIQVATGKRTWAEFGQGVASSAKVGVSGLVGAEVGLLLGGPLGAVIGGFCLPLVVEFAEKWLFGVTSAVEDPDVATLASTMLEPAMIGAALAAMASSRQGVEAYRLSQMALLFSMLGKASAKVFPGRVVTGRAGYQTSADIVVVHEGRVFAVDFRAWKGHLMPAGRSTRVIPLKVINRRLQRDGTSTEETLRNPLLGPSEFADAARQHLSRNNLHWGKASIEPVVVFPEGGASLHSDLAAGSRMVDANGFRARLEAGDGRATPAWMLDDLMQLPVWDSVERADGEITQAVLENDCFTISLVDGAVDVPFASVARVEPGRDGTGDPDFASAKVILNDATVLAGAVGAQNLVLNRKGSRVRHDIRELRMICPGNLMLAA